MTDAAIDAVIETALMAYFGPTWPELSLEFKARERPKMAKAIQPFIQALKLAEETLEWYRENTRLCRLIHDGGDCGRHALSDDGGKRAEYALEAINKLTTET